jgi:transposase
MTRGGFGSKVHLMTDGGGLPIGVVLTQGNRNECPVFDELLDATLANAGGALPVRLAADRGYSADRIRGKLLAMGVAPVIPYRRSEHVADRTPLNGRAYKGRNVIERCVGRLKEMRRIGTRYEKLASSYLAMLTLGMAVLYLRALQ